MIEMMNYKFTGEEKFSKSDLSLFRNKLLGMRELNRLRKEILKERTRRMREYRNNTSEPQENTEEDLTDEDLEENFDSDAEEPYNLGEDEEEEEY